MEHFDFAGFVIAIMLIGGFGYFLYGRIKAKRAERAGGFDNDEGRLAKD